MIGVSVPGAVRVAGPVRTQGEPEPVAAPVVPMLFDDRWIADHGIGRTAREWLRRGRAWRAIGRGPSPASPLDPLWLAGRLAGEPIPFFSPAYNAPLLSRRPFVVTVHDLCYLDLARTTGRLRQVYTATVVRDRCHAARGVVTVSAFSRARLLDRFGLDADSVEVVSPGVSDAFFEDGPVASFARPYVLGVGNRSPHKNEARTIEAFAASGLAATHDFVLSGQPRPLGPAAESVRPRFLGRLDDRELAAMYRGADALIFVSLYEGFGSPAAEAMACGTPVLCSRGGALEETTGDAALHVDPESVADIAAGMERIVHDAPLRARLRAAGPPRARRFDWNLSVAALQAYLGRRLEGA
ncbi:MAG: hypothetical protein RJA99_3459 [Pseudomonadota bacterium]